MGATETLERYEIEIPIVCVGCRHRDEWGEEHFLRLDRGNLTRKVYFHREPSNPESPEAVAVMFAGRHCGYVKESQLQNFNEFYAAFKMMQPYIGDYNYGVRIDDVATDGSGKVQWFEMTAKAVADVPTSVAEAIDAL